MRHDQPVHSDTCPDRDPEIQSRLRKPCRKCIAGSQLHTAPVPQQMSHMDGKPPRDIGSRGDGAGDVEEMLQIIVRGIEHHPHERDRLEWRTQAPKLRAKPSTVICRCDDRTPLERAAGRIRMIIGIFGGDEAHLGLALEKLDHRRTGRQIGIHHLALIVIARFLLQIAVHSIARVRHLTVRTAGNPQYPAGERRRSAEAWLLLQHEHRQSCAARCDRRGQTRRPRSDHDKIDV
ncbi:hypothetical protein D9M73_114470 [compost metagenome]